MIAWYLEQAWNLLPTEEQGEAVWEHRVAFAVEEVAREHATVAYETSCCNGLFYANNPTRMGKFKSKF